MPTRSEATAGARQSGVAQTQTPHHRRRQRQRRVRVAPLVAPSVLLIAVVFLIPVLIVLWVSLHRMDYFDVGEFAGLGQYTDLLNSSDFWRQLRVTLIFVFGTLAVSVVAGFTIAILLQGTGRFRTFFRTALLLPWALSQATVAIAWVWVLNPAYGPVAYLTQKLGMTESLFI